MDYKERLLQFESILSTKNLAQDPTIDLYKFRHLCFLGIPDKPGIRQKSWKILLGYLPLDKRKWKKVLAEQRSTYYSFVRDLLADPNEEELKDYRSSDDHPLNSSPTSKWADYFTDNSILEQIDKDVRRTLPDFAFFQQPVYQSPLSPLSPSISISEKYLNRLNGTRSPSILETLDNNDDSSSLKSYNDSIFTNPESESDVSSLDPQLNIKFQSIPFRIDVMTAVTPITTRRSIFKRVQLLNNDFGNRRTPSPAPSYRSYESRDYDNEVDLHWEAVERILFIYAKLNPGVGYVQGMNEILGPIYYTMANDCEEEGKAHAEADSFFVFTLLMSHIRDYFVRSLDTDDMTGIGHTMKKMMRRLKTFEPELCIDLERKSLHPTYFSFRWFTVLLTQEFALPDVIRLWDSIFADNDEDDELSNGFEFLVDFCCAMLICVKDELLRGSFADNIKILQNYPIQDPKMVLLKAYSLRESRLLAKLNGEDIDSSSESEGDDYDYLPYNYNNTDYVIQQHSSKLNANDMRIKGLAMLRKLQGAMNGINDKGLNENKNGFFGSLNNNNDGINVMMSEFAMKFTNAWKKNFID
ncbi:TBC1 domain family member 13 isoform X1 [Gigaspora margarita]|uniref:TBC1 domain family member 13 isoform X1 n=1 Tax=Gigaspora margarita TaxID=4874 RepID=A0A8H3XJH4_GIGMA|nr:TBC1 domain family member 13 isoform X1 [Gigaspora margarita]